MIHGHVLVKEKSSNLLRTSQIVFGFGIHFFEGDILGFYLNDVLLLKFMYFNLHVLKNSFRDVASCSSMKK